MAAKSIILRAKLNGELTELLVKTNAANVYVDETTTLAAHLLTLAKQADLTTLQNTVNSLGALAQKDKVSQSDLDEALAGVLSDLTDRVETLEGAGYQNAAQVSAAIQAAISATGHAHFEKVDAAPTAETAQENVLYLVMNATTGHYDIYALVSGEVVLIDDTTVDLTAYSTTEQMNAAITAAIDALKIGDYAKAADLLALTTRVGNLETGKADKATTLEGYGITDAYTATVIDQKIADAVSSATGGESAAAVKSQLDAYKTSNDSRVDALEADTHTHENKTVLDGVTAEKVAAWDGKSTTYFSASEPAALAEGDLWVQIIE